MPQHAALVQARGQCERTMVSSVVINEKYQLNSIVFKISWIWHEGTCSHTQIKLNNTSGKFQQWSIPVWGQSHLCVSKPKVILHQGYEIQQLQQLLFLHWSLAFPGSRKKWSRIQIRSVPPCTRWREVCFLSQITSVILLTALSNRNCCAGTAEGEPTTTQGWKTY